MVFRSLPDQDHAAERALEGGDALHEAEGQGDEDEQRNRRRGVHVKGTQLENERLEAEVAALKESSARSTSLPPPPDTAQLQSEGVVGGGSEGSAGSS